MRTDKQCRSLVPLGEYLVAAFLDFHSRLDLDGTVLLSEGCALAFGNILNGRGSLLVEACIDDWIHFNPDGTKRPVDHLLEALFGLSPHPALPRSLGAKSLFA
jgi:hypothetical protein